MDRPAVALGLPRPARELSRSCPPQVLKGQLALLEPTIDANDFLYDEGQGLEPDEVERQTARLGMPLQALPGGGLGHGTVADISDQSQALNFQLHISHQVGAGLPRDLGLVWMLAAAAVPSMT